MASWGMAISTLRGVYHELRLAEPVVPGSVLSLYHTFTPLILITAWWGGAYRYPCFQMGKLGFRELRCLAHMSTAISPPWPGRGWLKSGSLESLQDFSAEPCGERGPSVPVLAWGWLWPPSPDTEAASLGQKSTRSHMKSSREKNLLTPAGPSVRPGCSSTLLSSVSWSILFCVIQFELGFCHLKSPD